MAKLPTDTGFGRNMVQPGGQVGSQSYSYTRDAVMPSEPPRPNFVFNYNAPLMLQAINVR